MNEIEWILFAVILTTRDRFGTHVNPNLCVSSHFEHVIQKVSVNRPTGEIRCQWEKATRRRQWNMPRNTQSSIHRIHIDRNYFSSTNCKEFHHRVKWMSSRVRRRKRARWKTPITTFRWFAFFLPFCCTKFFSAVRVHATPHSLLSVGARTIFFLALFCYLEK